jgi:hypothetical protein
MDTDFVNLLMVAAYLIAGTVGIALLVGWALKRFCPPPNK